MMQLVYLLAIGLFIHFIILKEWTNLHARWCVMRNYRLKTILKPFGFCPHCLAGQIAFWCGVFQSPYDLFQHLGLTALVIVTTKILTHEKD